ncbi:methyl-accepting chemotaxis protein [Vibrio cholerae]|nr:methyl-accepting chemotaxis protein [Vibrio cholerae]
MEWLRSVSIKVRFSLLIIALLGAMLGMGWNQKIAVNTVNNLLNSMYLNQVIPISEITKANMQAIYHHRELFNYVIESQLSEMDRIASEFDRYEKQMNFSLDKYRATELTEDEIKMLADFDRYWLAYKAAARNAMETSYRGDNESAMRLMKSDVASTFQLVDDTLSALVDKNVALGKKAYDSSDIVVTKIEQNFYLIIAMVVILSGTAGILVVRSILLPLADTQAELAAMAKGELGVLFPVSGRDELTELQKSMNTMRNALSDTVRKIHQIIGTLSSAASQLSSAAAQVMTSSNMQSQATASSAAAIEEMSTAISQLSHSAGSANEQAVKSGQLAQQGEKKVEHVSRDVGSVTEAITLSANQIRQLADDITRVGQITVIIKGVADQTNLLALNAAIEAARAGDMGRGFAVVADEVRQLAERTGKATQEIENMISSVQSTAINTVNSMNSYVQNIDSVLNNTTSASNMMAEVDRNSQVLVSLISEINTMLREQSTASQLIAQSVEEVNNMSQENVSASECVNHESSQLLAVVTDLKQSVAFFKLD